MEKSGCDPTRGGSAHNTRGGFGILGCSCLALESSTAGCGFQSKQGELEHWEGLGLWVILWSIWYYRARCHLHHECPICDYGLGTSHSCSWP